MKGKTVAPAVSPEEVPTPAADLIVSLEPHDCGSPLEAPTSAAELTVRLEPCDSNSSG